MKDILVISDKNGKEKDYYVLATFDYNNKKFVLYTDYKTDENNKALIFSSIYKEDGQKVKLEKIIEPDEINIVKEFIMDLERKVFNKEE